MTLSELIEELKKLEDQGYGDKNVYFEVYAPVYVAQYIKSYDRINIDEFPLTNRTNSVIIKEEFQMIFEYIIEIEKDNNIISKKIIIAK